MILHGNDLQPGMRFEALGRAAFNDCEKGGDPFGYASQENYFDLANTPSEMGKRMLSTFLIKMVIDIKDSKSENTKQLIELDDLVWKATTREAIIEVLDKGIVIASRIYP